MDYYKFRLGYIGIGRFVEYGVFRGFVEGRVW